MKNITILILPIFFACTAFALNPKPNSLTSTEEEKLSQQIQKTDFLLSQTFIDRWKIDREIEWAHNSEQTNTTELDRTKEKITNKINSLTNQKQEITNNLSSYFNFENWNTTRPWFETNFDENLNDRTETIAVENLDQFDLSKNSIPFPLENRFFNHYNLVFMDNMDAPVDTPRGHQHNDEPQLRARLDCNGDIVYKDRFLFFSKEKRSHSYEFDWYNSHRNAQRVQVQITPEVSQCLFSFKEPNAKEWKYGIRMQAIDQLQTAWMDLAHHLEVCARPANLPTNSVESFFWSQDFVNTTCPKTFEKLTNLKDPILAFQTRIQNLTGAIIPEGDIKKQDPTMPLDFSTAPRYDIIYISSLNFSADFLGNILARALRYHADRGTQIRILVPDVSITKKDLNILKWLASNRPNVKFQRYQFKMSDGEDGALIDKFHRVNHTKVFIGYSTSHPENNFFITGGRNIRDSYFFKDPTLLKRWSYLKNYAEEEEDYIYYDDMEIEIRGNDFIKSVLAQVLSLWNRDLDNQNFRSTNINIPAQLSPDQKNRLISSPQKLPLIRHFTSLPYVDGYQLEKIYVQLIDSAQNEILMTSPYFRPPKSIGAAFQRAHDRGVKIKIITRVNLNGDTVPKIAEEVNREGINEYLNAAEFFEWSDDKSILHEKLIVVDQKLSFVSSVNLNHRSFLHDIESGTMILDPEITAKIHSEISTCLSKSKIITQKFKVNFFNHFILELAEGYF